MIERKFVKQKLREFQIEEFVSDNLKGAGHSKTKIQRTPLGEKVIVHASRPGLVVGRKGQNIKELTKVLKKKFKSENPQIEISEVEEINLDANIVAERIANSLERFGASKFKGIGHKVMADVMGAGALGIEIVISGKIPSSRAKTWRFYQGYLKKCGDISIEGVNKAYSKAKLKVGIVGIKVKIMPPTVRLPDKIRLLDEIEESIEEVKKEKLKEEESKTEEKEQKEVSEKEEGKSEDLEKEKTSQKEESKTEEKEDEDKGDKDSE